MLASGLALVGMVTVAAGQEPAPDPAGKADVPGASFPQTAEDHLSMADDYVNLAASHRREADLHRRMITAYERLAADLAAQPAQPKKRGRIIPVGKRARDSKDPAAEYRSHCEAYIHGAELLADEAEKLAGFHRARARELRVLRHP